MYEFNEILGEYLFYYMKQNFIHDVLKKSAKSTVDSLRRPMFLEFQVAFPKSIDEQTTIIHFINNELGNLKLKVEKTKKLIDLLTEYRTALISVVVTGKIKVTEDI
jgi:type I restriction enzyme S subunit